MGQLVNAYNNSCWDCDFVEFKHQTGENWHLNNIELPHA